jgi:cyclopropane fatty-acyl-phospholipid synthase-like methyltransferase
MIDKLIKPGSKILDLGCGTWALYETVVEKET